MTNKAVGQVPSEVNLLDFLPELSNTLMGTDKLSFHVVRHDTVSPLALNVHDCPVPIELVVKQSGFAAERVSSHEAFSRESTVDAILKDALAITKAMSKIAAPVLIHVVIEMVPTKDQKPSYESSVRLLSSAIEYESREKTRHGSIFTNLWIPRSYIAQT